MRTRILPEHITLEDLSPEIAEIVERNQILMDRAYDALKECIHQHNQSAKISNEADMKVLQSTSKLGSYSTKRELYLSLGIVALAFYCMGYWAHG